MSTLTILIIFISVVAVTGFALAIVSINNPSNEEDKL